MNQQISVPQMDDQQIRTHDTDKIKDIMARLTVDAATAVTAALTISPIMVVIDRAVVEATVGQQSLLKSMRSSVSTLARHPIQHVRSRPFAIMMLLYSPTYLTANVADTLVSLRENLPAASSTSSTTKFAGITSVNLGLSLYKDAQYARLFGTSSKLPLPLRSYVPLSIRDGITLFATFNLPPSIAPMLPEVFESCMSRLTVAQLAAPAASQILATPLHLLGLDLYYRSGRLTMTDRLQAISRTVVPTTIARMCRIIPAYGLGGVVNNDVRSIWMARLEEASAIRDQEEKYSLG